MLVAGVARSEEFATKDYVDAQDTKLANRTVDLRKALVTTVEDVQLSSGDNGVIPHMMTQDQRVKYIRNLITGFDSSSTSQANPLGVITTPLQTEAQTAFGAINELKDAIDNIDIPEQVQPDWNATTGKAAILNKPEIPAAQVQSDWNATEGMGAIKNKPTLATVATSGSYNDLDNKPTIPSIEGLATTQELTSGLAGKQNSLSEAQLAAANSGITAEKVASYDGYAATIAAKADAASLDDYVTEDALTTALADKANANIIGSGFDSTNTVAAALATKQNTLSFDATPTANSTNPVTSGGIYNAISAMSGDVESIGEQITDALEAYTTTADLEENYATKAELPTVDSALSTTSENAVQNKVVTNALNTKLTQTVGNAPAAGQYVLGYVDGVQTYIAIVDADGE